MDTVSSRWYSFSHTSIRHLIYIAIYSQTFGHGLHAGWPSKIWSTSQVSWWQTCLRTQGMAWSVNDSGAALRWCKLWQSMSNCLPRCIYSTKTTILLHPFNGLFFQDNHTQTDMLITRLHSPTRGGINNTQACGLSLWYLYGQPHVYPQVEWAIPTFTPQPQSITAYWLVLISTPVSWWGRIDKTYL